jgi:BRCT domain, a BRCA1 C-terminus domain
VSDKGSSADTDRKGAFCKEFLAEGSRSHLGRSRQSGSQLKAENDTENVGSLRRPRQLIGNPVDGPPANPVYSIRRDGYVRLGKLHPDGTTVLLLANKYLRKMEDFIESLDGSDCSNLSTTQENDPAAYEGIQQLLDSESFISSRNQSGKPAPDIGRSYTDNDTGHIKLDFSPRPVPLDALGDDDSKNREPPNKPGVAGALREQNRNPQTPAQPRFVPNNPGTVMRASQLFLETQPSPRSRDRNGIGLSSDRPTPGLYNIRQFQNYESSPLVSPLMQRADKLQPAHLAASDGVSSPLELSEGRVANKSHILLPQNFRRTQGRPELYHTYETRKESQDRRDQMANADKDDNQSSDDGFSDSETEMSRRARRAKEAAAREIAGVRASIPPPNLKSDEVEVPSTSNRRRRSRSEAYASQCNEDIRNTREETTIVDSQSVPVAATFDEDFCSIPESSESKPVEPAVNISGSPISSHGSTSSAVGSSIRPNTPPRLEQDAECETTEGDPEVVDSSATRPAVLPLVEVCSNRNLIYSKVGHKAHSLPEGDALVPETSPLELHQHRFAVLEHNFTQVIAPEELDESENPLTQDDTFNEAVKSPSPQLQPRARSFKWSKPRQRHRTETRSRPCEIVQSAFFSTVNSSTTTERPTIAEPENTSLAQDKYPKLSTAPINNPSTAPDTPAIRSLTSENGNTINDYLHAITNGMPLEPGASRSGLKLANKGSSKLIRLVKESKDVPDKPAVEEGTRPSGTGNTGDPCNKLATGELKDRFGSQILSNSINDSCDVATTAKGSNKFSTGEKEMRTFDFNQKSVGSAKKGRNTSDTSRVTRKNKALPTISTPSNNAPPTSTSKPATRSSRQTSVTSEKSKTAESEEQAASTVLQRGKPTLSHMMAENPDFFHNMVFSVSYVNKMEEKKRVVQLIKQCGGRLLENGFDELFEFASGEPGSDSGSTNIALTTEAQNIGFVCLIADEHSRKAKYMQALALGLPCISGRWIGHCVAKGQILDWGPYLLAAGESSFLGGAVHNRNLQPYCATTAKFARHFEERKKLLEKKSVLLIMGKGRAEERKKAYLFLTQALGAHRVKRVHSNQEAKRVLLESESKGELWNLLYVDEKEEAAEKAIFGAGSSRKRKRGFVSTDESDYSIPKKVRIISDEFVIQSLILGKLLDED